MTDPFVLLARDQMKNCSNCECPNRKPPTKSRLRRIGETRLLFVIFLLIVASQLGGNLALFVHAQDTRRDVQNLQLDSAKQNIALADIVKDIAELKGMITEQGNLYRELSSNVHTIEGVGIGVNTALLLIAGFGFLRDRKGD